jgi:hypothetical protein
VTQPLAYCVISWFQICAFKFNVYRYLAGIGGLYWLLFMAMAAAVGLCTLNQVDP